MVCMGLGGLLVVIVMGSRETKSPLVDPLPAVFTSSHPMLSLVLPTCRSARSSQGGSSTSGAFLDNTFRLDSGVTAGESRGVGCKDMA